MFKLILLISLNLLTLSGQAANITQVNRYATVTNRPLPAQINPLLAVQHIHFPPEIKTVGEAIRWWLQYSGFNLAAKEKQPPSLQTVMQQTLPQTQRHLGPLTVKDGLEILAGQSVFTLTDDPLLRQVNFKLKPAWQSKQATRSQA